MNPDPSPPPPTMDLRRIGDSKRRLFLWGAGDAALQCLDLLQSEGMHPDAFVEGDASKWGSYLHGIPVRSPDCLDESPIRGFVFVADSGSCAGQIEVELAARGFERGSDFALFAAAASIPGGNAAARRRGLLGMTTQEEQDYLFEYARRKYRGAGALVDLGSWMGSTTIPLALGLEAAAAPSDWTVRAFDTFVWQSWMEPFAGELRARFQPGDSFMPEFRRRLGRLAPRVSARACDLATGPWDGSLIEFLLVDAMKSWELCQSINRAFVGALAKGGLLAHQDFKFWSCPWIHISMYRLRQYFEIEQDLPASSTVVFRLLETPEPVFLDLERDGVSEEEVDAAYAHWAERLSGRLASHLRVARALALWETGHRFSAEAALRELIDEDYSFPEPSLKAIGARLRGLDESAMPRDWTESVDRAKAQGRPILVWGAGSGGRKLLQRHRALLGGARGFVDSDLIKTGSCVEGLRIFGPAALDECDGGARPFVVVATVFRKEVEQRLRAMGWKLNRDYCRAPV